MTTHLRFGIFSKVLLTMIGVAVTALPSSQHFTRLVEALAKEIGDPAKEAQFKQRVLSSFRGGAADSAEPGAAAAP